MLVSKTEGAEDLTILKSFIIEFLQRKGRTRKISINFVSFGFYLDCRRVRYLVRRILTERFRRNFRVEIRSDSIFVHSPLQPSSMTSSRINFYH